MVIRYDAGRLAKAERTPAGGVRVPATISRTGVQRYTDENGNVIREYRPPEEVFHPDSLATLADAPVTRGHPPEGVNPRNWKQTSLGHVTGHAPSKQDAGKEAFVRTVLAVQDADGIRDIESGDLIEVSCGYSCKLDNTPGVTPNGEHFDCIQREIRFNHVALGPNDWARAGSEARLRLDGGQVVPDALPPKVHKMKIRFDGVEVEAGSEAHVSLLTAGVEKRDARVAQLETDLAKAKSDAATAAGTASAKITTLETDLAKAKADASPEAVQAKAEALAAARADAATVLGAEYKFDGKSDLEVKIDMCEKLAPGKLTADDKKSPEFVAAFLRGVRATAKHDHNVVTQVVATNFDSQNRSFDDEMNDVFDKHNKRGA